MPERTCEQCGADLRHRRRDALYCGGGCRAEASRERALLRPATLIGDQDPGSSQEAHRGAQIMARPHLYPCGLTADEIVAFLVEAFDAVEVQMKGAA